MLDIIAVELWKRNGRKHDIDFWKKIARATIKVLYKNEYLIARQKDS